MKTLYIISRSPFLRKEGKLPFELADDSDGILLIQNGVLLCNATPEWMKDIVDRAVSSNVKIYACKEDVEARGISSSKFDLLSYDEIIDLFEKYDRIA